MKTTPQSQLRFESSPCTGAPSNRKILRKENRPERARRAYITCAERNHYAAGTSRARSAHITFSSPAHLVVLYEMATNYGLTSSDEKKRHSFECLSLDSGSCLSSRAVSSQVLSARQSLTSVFGMGTGGPSASISPTFCCICHS